MAADFEALYDAATMGDRETNKAMLAKNPKLVRASDENRFTTAGPRSTCKHRKVRTRVP
jgi:hypothetical protein